MDKWDIGHNRRIKGKYIGLYFTSHLCLCMALFLLGWDFTYPATEDVGDNPFYCFGFLWSMITAAFCLFGYSGDRRG